MTFNKTLNKILSINPKIMLKSTMTNIIKKIKQFLNTRLSKFLSPIIIYIFNFNNYENISIECIVSSM